MITSILKGGLGNQLWQLAAGFSHARKMGVDYAFCLSDSSCPMQGHPPNKYLNNLFRNFKFIEKRPNALTFKNDSLHYQELPRGEEMVLEGYFQNLKYIKSSLREFLYLINVEELYSEYVKELCLYYDLVINEYSILHIRGGDYNKLRHLYPECGQEYYSKILNNHRFQKVIVITDDFQYANHLLKPVIDGEYLVFLNLNEELFDFALLNFAKNIICSNSSFSWWGSMLNTNKNKLVYLPYVWYESYTIKDLNLLPEDWTPIL